jgi:hypothetical protein
MFVLGVDGRQARKRRLGYASYERTVMEYYGCGGGHVVEIGCRPTCEYTVSLHSIPRPRRRLQRRH